MKKKPLIKICGMRAPENIRDVAMLLPDYMGFIFYTHSPRYAGEHFIVPDDLPDSVTRVGVFVNTQTGQILETAKRHRLTVVQLHGNEPASQCDELKNTGLQIIKVFSVGTHFDFSRLEPYRSAVTYFMFDTKGEHYGGNARTFDWKILEGYDQEVPFFLSGGLDQDNVELVAELAEMNIHAIDLNSGVEFQPGMKDVDKIKIVMRALNKAYT